MAETMDFPNDWHDFIKSYSFVDREEIYTNGARLMTELRVEQLVEHILREKEQQWVSVKDRMPEKSGEYLCWFGANKVAIGPAIVTYVDEWKAFGDLVSLEKYPNITHWMPLPEPPEEDT